MDGGKSATSQYYRNADFSRGFHRTEIVVVENEKASEE
jgi:hypothetical protein